MNKINEQPLISVIVPVYNTAPYLRRCLDSILAQTYPYLEIICVDDGSTDGSKDILVDYAKKDRRIKPICKMKEGVSAARNLALENANGEYIGFIDSDDYVKNTYFEKLMEGFSDKKIDIVTCGFNYAYDDRVEEILNDKDVPTKIIPVRDFVRYMYERDKYRGVASYLWTRLIKRNIIIDEKNGKRILFDNTFDTADDVVFVMEVTVRAKYTRYINEHLYYYYQRQNSIVHNNGENLKKLVWANAFEAAIKGYGRLSLEDSTMDMIKRIYVYRCGKLLEAAIERTDSRSARILNEKIKKELPVYVKTNIDYLDRIQWLVQMMIKGEKLYALT